MLKLHFLMATAAALPLLAGTNLVEAELERYARTAAPIEPGTPIESPRATGRFQLNKEGYLKLLQAPASHHFPTDAPSGSKPEEIARAFLIGHAPWFGMAKSETNFVQIGECTTSKEGTVVALRQIRAGLPVYEGNATVRIGTRGGIVRIESSILPTSNLPPARPEDSKPALASADAMERARAWMERATGKNDLTLGKVPQLCFVQPALGPDHSELRLAWEISATRKDDRSYYVVHVDARTGEVVRKSSNLK